MKTPQNVSFCHAQREMAMPLTDGYNNNHMIQLSLLD